MKIKGICEGSARLGAKFLNFIKDEKGIAYHSHPDTWQRDYGYNDLYDDVFKIGSYMNYGRLTFEENGKKYALWAWKGDYWNLQSGAEVGLYVYSDTYHGTEHYDVVDFEVPMTLSLYNNLGNGKYENIFSWVPREKQWWITGFNPEFTEPDPDVMVSVASVDLSDHPELFDAICKSKNKESSYLGSSSLKRENLIFDEENKIVWLQWYNGDVA